MCGLKNVSHLKKQRVPLCPLLTEFASALLIGELYKSERRLEPVDKHYLDVLLIDGGVDLVKQFDEQVVREIIIRPDHMNPCAFILWVGIIKQPGQLIRQ